MNIQRNDGEKHENPPDTYQEEIKVGTFEAAKTRLSLHNDVAFGRLHLVANLRSPLVVRESLPILYSSKNAVWILRDLRVSTVKLDRAMNNLAALGSSGVHKSLAVLDHASGVHNRLHGVMKLATFGRELVLVFDEDDGRFFGFH